MLLPIIILFGPLGFPIFVIVGVGVGHIHAVLHPFAIFPAVKLAPLVIFPVSGHVVVLPTFFNFYAGRPV